MFNEIHEIQSKCYELQQLNIKLLKKSKADGNAYLHANLEEADGLLDELGEIYGVCIDIIEEE